MSNHQSIVHDASISFLDGNPLKIDIDEHKLLYIDGPWVNKSDMM